MTNKPATRMQSVKKGEILTELVDVKSRWEENYEELYNTQNHVDKEMADGILKCHLLKKNPTFSERKLLLPSKNLLITRPPAMTIPVLKNAMREISVDILHRHRRHYLEN